MRLCTRPPGSARRNWSLQTPTFGVSPASLFPEYRRPARSTASGATPTHRFLINSVQQLRVMTFRGGGPGRWNGHASKCARPSSVSTSKARCLGPAGRKNSPDARFLQIAKPLLRNHYEKERLLGKHLCPADARIQSFLDAYLADCCPGGAPRLPASTFILDRPGLARAMSLPPDADVFSSQYVRSYRVP